MAIIKCKMCGGDLTLTEGSPIAKCEYCGSLQTVPNAESEKMLTLFARANRLRLNCEFDKAFGVYEAIVAEFPEEAEAYWGLVLCKFGIEYVDDPATGKKIPTCHRSSFDSIMDDSDLEQALENADPAARKVYRDEAKAIEEIRKGIIAVSANEEPYDIFICYKETDENGDRTLDSVLAQDVYDALTGKDYRVFFSRISLEDKLGVEYEPYIFAALNSAKIMLAFGTDYEYFNAVWVKNEWSRFLKLMADDKEKHLIPCYKGIDAYDMPKEFARLQAQDMGKVGAIQDLLRGVEKLIHQQAELVNQSVVATQMVNPGTAPLLERAYMFLEDGSWEEAVVYCERVLDMEPRNARAYTGKLMAELKVHKEDELCNCEESFENNTNYQKAIRFADPLLKNKLNDAISYIKDRNKNAEIERTYQVAVSKMNNAVFKGEYDKAAEMFKTIIEHKDAKVCMEHCLRKAKITESLRAVGSMLSAGDDHVAARKADGTTRALGNNEYGQVELPRMYKAIGVSVGDNHTVVLRPDGTVIGYGSNEFGQIHVGGWKNVVAISAGGDHTVGLKGDGTVVAVGNNEYGQLEVSRWKDIEEVAAGWGHTIGLKMDGSVIAVGDNTYGQCKTSGWFEMVSIATNFSHTVGVKVDGTVVAVGDNEFGQCNTSSWRRIVAVSAGGDHTLGLRDDGTVVAVGNNNFGQCDVSKWENIVAISAGGGHSVGIRADGTVVSAGEDYDGALDELAKWKLFDNIESIIGQ